jgi:hypothetical protein
MLYICKILLFIFIGLLYSCSDVTSPQDRNEQTQIDVQVADINLGEMLPGAYFVVNAQGLLTGATITVTLLIADRLFILENQLLDNGQLEVRMDLNEIQKLGSGLMQGVLQIDVVLDQAQGRGEAQITFALLNALIPQLLNISTWTSPSTVRTLEGNGFLKRGEGRSILVLDGFINRMNGQSMSLTIEINITEVSLDRRTGFWMTNPEHWGLSPGIFMGQAYIINRTHLGDFSNQPIQVSLEYLKPQVTNFGQLEVSRGQNLDLFGYGFVGEQSGYFTTATFTGVLNVDHLGQSQSFTDYTLNTLWISGEHLKSYFNPTFVTDNLVCNSSDLGGQSGRLVGEITVSIHNQLESIIGDAMPINLEITGSKQVVYLKFLPAFTDSLRLFGLRNYSAQIIDKILNVVIRDYQGINVEFRLIPPEDYALYSVIEIGGPDPNAQSLFGLDNTAGLDICNQRLDDYLAGKNADSGGSFGGVFVESFLRLSPTLGDSSLSDPLFDELFLPVIRTPAQIDETQNRMQIITQAIQALGHLVGNTLSHELGHSLGLPVDPGCGEYHNSPGELQIMDCGKDRPFLERAGLDPRGFATWTIANRQYLEQILPLR